MKTKKKIFIGISLFSMMCLFQKSFCQNERNSSEITVGYNSSSDQEMPFWIKSNSLGTQKLSGNSFFIRYYAKILSDTLKNRNLQYEISSEIIAFSETKFEPLFPELNIRIQKKNLIVNIGRKEQQFGLTDKITSSGSVSWSRNSIPLPKVEFETANFIPFVGNKTFIKSSISHGWFGKEMYAEDYYLHQKSVYFKIGNNRNTVNFITGILHNVQWGGKSKIQNNKPLNNNENEYFAKDWPAIKNILFPITRPKLDSSSNYSTYDSENRFGNHVGQIDIGLTIDKPFSIWTIYKETPFETGQTFSSLGNIDDGLYGISYCSKLTFPFFKRFTFEYLQTTNQGIYRPLILRLIGFKGRHYGRNHNNYFNHNQYFDGWSNDGMGIGTPFIITKSDLSQSTTFDDNQSIYQFPYNRIKAAYFGSESYLKGFRILSRISISRNLSITTLNLPKVTQFSCGLNIIKPIIKSGYIISLHGAIDRGQLITENKAIQFSITKIL